MGRSGRYLVTAIGLIVVGLTWVWANDNQSPHARHGDSDPSRFRLIAENALLAGLEAKAVFPFIDTTPGGIRRAHIAITDSTATCAPGASAPASIQILVGEAGVALVPVMTPATNTGISTRPDQCVFHATVRAGQGGIPAKVTDIVVFNNGDAPLTGIHTVTVSAEVP